MGIVTLILTVGLVGRLTILTTRDTITKPLRLKFISLFKNRPGAMTIAADFIQCHWCISVWWSIAAAPLAYWAGNTAWFILPATAATASYAASLLSDR
jgi:hypothetical protein